jgi:hypothetical protein
MVTHGSTRLPVWSAALYSALQSGGKPPHSMMVEPFLSTTSEYAMTTMLEELNRHATRRGVTRIQRSQKSVRYR